MEPTEDASEALTNPAHQQDPLPTTPKRRYGLWALLGLVAVVALAWDWIPLPDAAKRIQSLPLNGPGFTGQELDWTEAEKSVLKGANAVKRLYRVGETSFVLTAIDGGSNRHAAHDPYYCFRGAGWKPASEKKIPFSPEGGEMVWLQLDRKGDRTEALFWFSNGVDRYVEPTRFWKESFLRRLTFGASGPPSILVTLQPVLQHDESDVSNDDSAQKISNSGYQDTVDWDYVLQWFYPIKNL